jgi:hypothetical protein
MAVKNIRVVRKLQFLKANEVCKLPYKNARLVREPTGFPNKSILFSILLMALTIPAAAQENLVINFNTGDLSLAGNIPLNDELGREGTMSFLNIGVEDIRTNIGMEFSPYKSFSWNLSESDNKITAYSLANFNFYWNILDDNYYEAGIYFGPFTSISYMFFEDSSINWNRFVFTAGLQVGFRIVSPKLNYRVVSLELGYRNIDGRSKYYMGAKVDLAVGAITLLYMLIVGTSASSENKK